jgi:hypothetical protein
MPVVAAERDGIRAEMWFDNTGELRRSRRVVSDATIPTRGTVGWHFGQPSWTSGEFFRFRIDAFQLVR